MVGCVDTQWTYVDTTGFFSSDYFLESNRCVDTQWTCVDTTLTKLCEPNSVSELQFSNSHFLVKDLYHCFGAIQ
ncbi:hypothetical protein Taro_054028, partial [Colocasia esculenta]|nr:hypothetical protein [Colocasia esculenta]